MADSSQTRVTRSLPKSWTRASLPALIPLDADQEPGELSALGIALRWSTLDEPQPYLQVVEKTCTPESIRTFATAVIDAWHACQFAFPNRWFANVVHLAPAAVAERLQHHLAANRAAYQYNYRYLFGVLAWTQEPTALRWLHAEAQYAILHVHQRAELPFRSYHALFALEELAGSKGLSYLALLDDTVPTLGLDSKGEVHFNLSPSRHIHVGFQPGETTIRDESGGLYSVFPIGRAQEDRARVKRCRHAYRQTAREYQALIGEQIQRFEDAMLTGAHWTWKRLRELTWEHPVLQPLVASVVWSEGETLFRIDESGCPIDVMGDSLELAPTAQIRIPHPIRISDAVLSAWSAHLSDFEILQIVDQMGRAVFALDAEEIGVRRTHKTAGNIVPERGWSREGLVRAWGHFGTVTVTTPSLQAQIDGEPTDDGLRVKAVQFHAHQGESEDLIRLWASEALRAIHMHTI